MTALAQSDIYALAPPALKSLTIGGGHTSSAGGRCGSYYWLISRYGTDYALTLDDEYPIHQDVLDTWALAIGLYGVEWFSELGGRRRQCRWQGTGEEPPPVQATFITGLQE